RHRRDLAEERPRARALADAVVAIGEAQHRAESRVELLAPLELLASGREPFFRHQIRALLEERLGRRLLGGGRLRAGAVAREQARHQGGAREAHRSAHHGTITDQPMAASLMSPDRASAAL